MVQSTDGWRVGRRVAPLRFVAFALVTVAGAAAAALAGLELGRALMLGFNAGAAVFLLSLRPLLDDAAADMRRRARDNDANRTALLAITGVVMIVVLVAIASELGGAPSAQRIVLVLATLALAWLFSNTVYALHYAHLFYSAEGGGDAGGIEVPKAAEPDYWDFAYFAFTLGMTFQTSDVTVTTRAMRRVVLGHCLAAFVFNLGVVAFTINTLGG